MSCWTKTSWSLRCTEVTASTFSCVSCWHTWYPAWRHDSVLSCMQVVCMAFPTGPDWTRTTASLWCPTVKPSVFVCPLRKHPVAAPSLPLPVSLCRTSVSVLGQRLVWDVGGGRQTLPIQLQDQEQIRSECRCGTLTLLSRCWSKCCENRDFRLVNSSQFRRQGFNLRQSILIQLNKPSLPFWGCVCVDYSDFYRFDWQQDGSWREGLPEAPHRSEITTPTEDRLPAGASPRWVLQHPQRAKFSSSSRLTVTFRPVGGGASLQALLSRCVWTEHRPEVSKRTLTQLFCPIMSPDQQSCDPHSFLEWLGAVDACISWWAGHAPWRHLSLRLVMEWETFSSFPPSQLSFCDFSENSADNFLSSLVCPEPKTTLSEALSISISGLLLPCHIHQLIQQIRSADFHNSAGLWSDDVENSE